MERVGLETVWVVAPHVSSFEPAWRGTRTDLNPQGEVYGPLSEARETEAVENRTVRFAAEVMEAGRRAGKLVIVVGTDTAAGRCSTDTTAG